MLSLPLSAVQVHSVYVQGPDHVGFGGGSEARTQEMVSAAPHLVAMSLTRLLRLHRVASLQALREVLGHPDMLDFPFDTSRGLLQAGGR